MKNKKKTSNIFNGLNLMVGITPEKQFRREEVVQRCSVKKVFLEYSQNSQENTCARVSLLIKL